jgi:FkbM family methyltransferase
VESNHDTIATLKSISRYGLIEHFSSDLIGSAVKAYGEWAWLETAFVAQLLDELVQSNRCAAPAWYDVGAFIGTFSLGLHALTAGLRSGAGFSGVAIEANVTSARVLRNNVAALAAGRIAVVTEVLGVDGHKVMAMSDAVNRGATSFGSRADEAGGELEERTCVPLWSIRNSFGPYGLLKLDVEGMEREVIQSDQEWIGQAKPVIYAECNESASSVALFDLLLWLGYDVYFFSFPAFNPGNFLGMPGDLLFNGAHEAALIGVQGRVNSGRDFERRGCVFRKLESRADLMQALWFTPRFVSRQFRDLGVSELQAAVERLSKGLTFDGFSRALCADAG